MERYHISQFYPCSEISLGSELFYVCELGKYLSDKGFSLSLDGVILNSILKKSRFWNYMRIAVHNNWICDLGIDTSELQITMQNQVVLKDVKNIKIVEHEVQYDAKLIRQRKENVLFGVCEPEEKQVFFTQKTDKAWFWSLKGGDYKQEQLNTLNLNSNLPSQSWVTLCAYVAVNRFLTQIPESFVVKFDDSIVTSKQLAVSDILLLGSETDALNGWFFMDLAEELQSSYEAWWYKWYEQGWLNRWYSPAEKIEFFSKCGFRKGDIIFFYERKVSQQANYIKSIDNCKLAILESCTKSKVKLRLIHTNNTRYGEELRFQNLTTAVKALYSKSQSYKEFRSTVVEYDWIDLGVEYMMHKEQFFISDLDNKNDVLVLDVTDGTRKDRFELSVVEGVYWLLKDYGIEFNESLYLKRYLKDKTPLYTRYMNGEDINA